MLVQTRQVFAATITYVNGSGKTGFIAHDSKFDFLPQAQSYMNTLYCQNQPGLGGLLLLAVFFQAQ